MITRDSVAVKCLDTSGKSELDMKSISNELTALKVRALSFLLFLLLFFSLFSFSFFPPSFHFFLISYGVPRVRF